MRKDGVRTASINYKADVTLYATKDSIPMLLESAMGGGMIASNANITETGDSGTDLSSWSLLGVKPHFNTDTSNKLYVNLLDETPGAGQARIDIYSDASQTSLVARGSGSDTTTISLVAQNSSGLSGSVALGTVSSSNSGITLTIGKLTGSWGGNINAYFTFAYFDGSNTHILADCNVDKIEFTSAENEAVMMNVSILGTSLQTTSTLLTANVLDFSSYAHKDVTLTRDPSSSNTNLVVKEMNWSIERPTDPNIANAAKPQAHVREGWTQVRGKIVADYADQTYGLITKGLATTYEKLQLDYTYGSDTMNVDFENVKYERVNIPGFESPTVNDVDYEFRADYDGTTDPAVISVDL
jgi:hypothetical protein